MNLFQTIANRTPTTEARPTDIDFREIPIIEIKPGENIRESNEVDIEDLKASIRTAGLLQPITVTRNPAGGYSVIYGFRRFTAYQELYREQPSKYSTIRAIVTDSENLLARQIIENVQREDLTQAELYKALNKMKSEGYTLHEIAGILGKSQGYIKSLMTGVNALNQEPAYRAALSSGAGATIQDVKEVKGIEVDKGAELLKEKAAGDLTRAQLRKKVKEVKQSQGSQQTGKPTKQPAPKKKKPGKNVVKYDIQALKVELSVKDAETYDLIKAEIGAILALYHIDYEKKGE